MLNISAVTNMYEGSTLKARHTFIANNFFVTFASFVSRNTTISFKYIIKNTNTNRSINVRIAHVVVADPEWRSEINGVVVTGNIPTDSKRVTDIELTIKPDRPKIIIRPVVEQNIRPNEERERSSTLAFGLTGELAKDAVCFLIIDEWIIDTVNGVEKLAKRYLFEHYLMLVDDDSPSKYDYLAVRAASNSGGGGVPTHVILLEGDASNAVGGITNALLNLQNAITANIPQLNRVFGASIQDVKSAKITTADGKVKAKTAFLVREGSPIAPLTLIILAIGGLAAIAGILFAIGSIMKVIKEEKQLEAEVQLAENRTKIAERTVASTSELADSIINNPNLNTTEKQKLLDTLARYTSSITQNIERSTSLLPPYLAEVEFNQLTLILLVVGAIVGGGIGAYVFGEIMKTRRAELLSGGGGGSYGGRGRGEY